MDRGNEQSKLWSNVQAYGLAVVCLLLGIVTGYLLHAPTQAVADVPQQQQPPSAGMMNAPTPEQLKHMADSKAAPLLAELQKNPNDGDVLAQLGSIYFRTQQFPLAVEYYGRAAKAKPTADGFVSLSNSYHFAGSDKLAIDTLKKALELDPNSADALFNLGLLSWQVNNDPKTAIQLWERFLKTNPNHPRKAYVESMLARAKQHASLPADAKTDKPKM